MGSIAAGVGVLTAGAGFSMFHNESKRDLAVSLVVPGLLLVAGGVPLFIIGIKKTPDAPETGALTPAPKRIVLAPVLSQNTWGLQLAGNL